MTVLGIAGRATARQSEKTSDLRADAKTAPTSSCVFRPMGWRCRITSTPSPLQLITSHHYHMVDPEIGAKIIPGFLEAKRYTAVGGRQLLTDASCRARNAHRARILVQVNSVMIRASTTSTGESTRR